MRICGALFYTGEVVVGGKVIRPASMKRCGLLKNHGGGHAAPRVGMVA